MPKQLYELLSDPMTERPVMDAMYAMQKLIVADLEAAAQTAQP